MDGDKAVAREARLVALIEQLRAREPSTVPLSVDDPLTEIGLDSLGMVKLMLAIEAEFDLTFAPCDITPENFRSVATIEALLARWPAAGPP